MSSAAAAESSGDAKSFIKSKWIANQMKERSAEFTMISSIKIIVGTWNVNGKKPDPDEDLLHWLHKDGGDPPDIFCLGLEEIVDLTTVNVVADSKTRQMSGIWCDCILAAVNTIGGGAYKLVHAKVRYVFEAHFFLNFFFERDVCSLVVGGYHGLCHSERRARATHEKNPEPNCRGRCDGCNGQQGWSSYTI
jgi:hypothetical protein